MISNIRQHLKNMVKLFFISIGYFIIIRLVAMATYTMFPKFDSDITHYKDKNVIIIESFGELGVISILIYLLRSVLNNILKTLGMFYFNDYEKYVIFVLNPALFSGPTDLKRKLDYAFS